jgi:predicted acylesterase/phospholipase RssA
MRKVPIRSSIYFWFICEGGRESTETSTISLGLGCNRCYSYIVSLTCRDAELTTKVQFAFQGGGAKLGALIAAAEAVYSQQKPLDFTISRVSGTSAGAIAACILATGQDPKKFKDRLIELANSNLDKICKTDNSEIPGHAEITSRPEKSGTWKVIQLCEEYRVLLSKAAVSDRGLPPGE